MKILIIEDEKRISKFLEIEFLREGYSVEVAFDGKSALEKVNNNFFNIILLDLMIPNIPGEDLCKKIRETSDVPIIVLTAKNSLISKIQLLDIGADDYVTKPFEIEELFARIRVILRNKSHFLTDGFETYGEIGLKRDSNEITVRGKIVSLSKKEYNLIEYFFLNKEMVLSREKIVESVWGYDFEGNLNIVDACIKNMRKKLKLEKPMISSIRGVGYIFKDIKE